MDLEMRRALVFAILMQGIESKSPDYMMEKWAAVQLDLHPELLLDSINLARFRNWKKTWRIS